MRVSIIGATGETGQSITDGLLKSTEPKYDITALTRPASLQKPEVLDLQTKGIHIVAADLEGPEDALTEVLKGTYVMISAINAGNLMAQIPLINASKAADPRTLNLMVFAYNELITQNQVYDLLAKMSGEKVERNHISVEAIMAGVAQMEASNLGPESPEFYELIRFQYWHSWAIRGDNTPEYAKYLGYLNTKDLYPDMGFIPFQEYVQEVLDGKGKNVYERSEDLKPLKVE
ncbi:hypothetical protein COL922a_013561 [Colletotrichum nupharicola]|nr:hypothetical protein COL922a_013561 [Colletotrichum nupharicola]